jgi:mono/diheme cytochrome c family protein
MTRTFATMILAFAAAVTVGCADAQPSVTASAASSTSAPTARVERGRYLVTMIGCSDCHTPMTLGPKGPEPDLSRFLSGHPEQMGTLPAAKVPGPWLWTAAATNTAFSGPWGVSYAANLTPDQNSGLGIWTEEMFVAALRTGRHMGVSREILPPMPWPAFRNASDEDLKSIYAFLRTIKPVTNHVPDPQIAAPIVTTDQQ